jgi:amidase
MKTDINRREFTLASLAAAISPNVNAGKDNAATTKQSDIQTLYQNSDATDLANHIQKGEVTALELLEEAIQRTEEINPKINAITLKHYELARDLLIKGTPKGAFGGVPFLLKDLSTQLDGTQTTGGSRLLRGIEAKSDNILVSRYKKAGLVIFGKTNTPEFGMALTTESYLHGPCRNPWNLEYSIAGSSGGSAAAVAAGIVPMAHATDGGGSIRVPASACGVFGFKPTRALTPRSSGPSMMSVSHVVSRSVRDSAAMLELTAGYSPGLPFVSPVPVGGYLEAISRPPKTLRIALVLDEPNLVIHEDVKAAIMKTAKTLQDLGHVVDTASPGVDFARLNAAQNTMMVAEFSRGMLRLAESINRPLDASTLEDASLMFVDAGRKTSAAEYLDAYQHIQSVTYQMAQFHQNWDLILSPVTVTPPPLLGVIIERPNDTVESYTERFRTYSAYTPLQNLTGVPAASIPVGLSKGGLPVAAMISAAIGHDALVMSVSRQLETALPFESKRPVI